MAGLSAEKRQRQNVKRRLRNRAARSGVRTAQRTIILKKHKKRLQMQNGLSTVFHEKVFFIKTLQPVQNRVCKRN